MARSHTGASVLERSTVTMRDWENLIRSEYAEMPGLSLTETQVRRLWQLDSTLAQALLQHLVETRFLRRTARGVYVLAS